MLQCGYPGCQTTPEASIVYLAPGLGDRLGWVITGTCIDIKRRTSKVPIVHLDVIGVPDQTIDELRHAGLLSA